MLWDEIAGSLKMVDAAIVPAPAEGFEERIWARVQPTLQEDSGSVLVGHAGRRTSSFAGWAAAAGLALAVTAAVLGARSWLARPDPGAPAPAAVVVTADPSGRERVLLTALDDHFQRSEMLLVELMNGLAAESDEFGFERQAADDLVDSSRLYRLAAEQNGQMRLALMLEDLESVLIEIARSPDRIDPSELSFLRARIEDDDLLFKVRAVSQQIQERQRDFSTE